MPPHTLSEPLKYTSEYGDVDVGNNKMYLKETLRVCTKSLFNAPLNDSHHVESTEQSERSYSFYFYTFEGMTKDATLSRHLLDGTAAKTENLNYDSLSPGQHINSESAK